MTCRLFVAVFLACGALCLCRAPAGDAVLPDDFQALIRAGNQALDEGRANQALEAFQRARELRPRDHEALMGLEKAMAAVDRMKDEEAILAKQKAEEEARRKAEEAALLFAKAGEDWKVELRKKLSRKVSFEFANTPFLEAVEFLRGITKAQWVVEPGLARKLAREPRQVTLTVRDMELEQALKWLCRLAEADFELRDQAVFIFAPRELGERMPFKRLNPDMPPQKGAAGRFRVRLPNGAEVESDGTLLLRFPQIATELLDRALDRPKDGLLAYRVRLDDPALATLKKLLPNVAPKSRLDWEGVAPEGWLLMIRGDDAAELRRAETLVRALLSANLPPPPVLEEDALFIEEEAPAARRIERVEILPERRRVIEGRKEPAAPRGNPPPATPQPQPDF